MKEGLKVGNLAELGIVVDDGMFASFGGKLVHKLYSTFSLAQHMEWVARKTILPYLEEMEEGLGCGLQVEHLKPTVGGARVKLVARVSKVEGNKVECEIEAFGPSGKLAVGSVSQAIVAKDWLKKRIDEITCDTERMNATLFDKQHTAKGE